MKTEKNSEDREEEGCIGGMRDDPRGGIHSLKAVIAIVKSKPLLRTRY